MAPRYGPKQSDVAAVWIRNDLLTRVLSSFGRKRAENQKITRETPYLEGILRRPHYERLAQKKIQTWESPTVCCDADGLIWMCCIGSNSDILEQPLDI